MLICFSCVKSSVETRMRNKQEPNIRKYKNRDEIRRKCRAAGFTPPDKRWNYSDMWGDADYLWMRKINFVEAQMCLNSVWRCETDCDIVTNIKENRSTVTSVTWTEKDNRVLGECSRLSEAHRDEYLLWDTEAARQLLSFTQELTLCNVM